MPITKGDVSNLQRYFFDDLLVHPNGPVVIAWNKNCDIPLTLSKKRSRVNGKVLEMCGLQHSASGCGGTTRKFKYDDSEHYIVTGYLVRLLS